MNILQEACLTALPFIGASATDRWFKSRVNQIDEWYYSKLKKPPLCPPNWVFPVVWTGLYPSMGYASYLILNEESAVANAKYIALGLYTSQLALNWAWSPIFFSKHKLGLSVVTIGLMTVNVALCTFKFNLINKTAGFLMLPYLAWLSLATYLTFGFWFKNRNQNVD